MSREDCCRRLKSLSILAAALSLLAAQASADAFGQSGRKVTDAQSEVTAGSSKHDDDVLRIKTEEVLLPVSVRDGAGAPVAGLSQERFIIYDNGVRQEIVSFNRQRVPANIVLLLDASSSVFSQMRSIRTAAKGFLEGLLENDQVCVMQFSDRVELLQDWGPASNSRQLLKSLDWRYHPGLRTTFYDGLYLAAEEQLRKVEGRRIVILLTDGLDTAERRRASFADALNAVRRAEASVYVVSLTASLRAQLEAKTGGTKLSRLFSGYDRRELGQYLALLDDSERLLTGLAERTGGRIFLPARDEDLSAAYQSIAEELRTQYIITYKPQPRVAAGDYRRVRVLITGGSYEVAAPEGYIGRNGAADR